MKMSSSENSNPSSLIQKLRTSSLRIQITSLLYSVLVVHHLTIPVYPWKSASLSENHSAVIYANIILKNQNGLVLTRLSKSLRPNMLVVMSIMHFLKMQCSIAFRQYAIAVHVIVVQCNPCGVEFRCLLHRVMFLDWMKIYA